ncbi:hypothetical protein N8Z97_01665 [Gammaproteobacteria bacterium]|nr:hypothetical protein [Gammaproteobacteria bacterium]
MSLYLAHISHKEIDSINIYNISDDTKSQFSINKFEELNNLNESDKLLVLIPSSQVTSYEFEENKSLSPQINTANFISDVDSIFIEAVSDNEYFLCNGAAYVVNKVFLKNLNKSLSELNAQIHVFPEYLINIIPGEDVITEFEDKYMISYSNKTGFSCDQSSLNQYLDIVINNKPNFSPLIYSSNENLIDKFQDKLVDKLFDLTKINLSQIDSLPNFYSLDISLNLLFKKLNLSKLQILLCAIAIGLIIAGPFFLTYKNNANASLYSSSTFDIFKAIDKDINKVIDPKSQIDQIYKQIPESNLISVKIPDLDVFFKYGSEYISDISIDIDASYASIKINSMPEFQFNVLKNNASRFNIQIIDNDLESINGFINGTLKAGLNNND